MLFARSDVLKSHKSAASVTRCYLRLDFVAWCYKPDAGGMMFAITFWAQTSCNEGERHGDSTASGG